ncbi:phage tail tape measure protein [Bergeyella cardium]|uniref:Phage tail tape measure protein n=2 Tax=Bergeyella cardium TaxID=1585976 RepID=A0A6P1QZH8_9FLAO|nr:phage tail tape measure protein [Bergeyella cardium]
MVNNINKNLKTVSLGAFVENINRIAQGIDSLNAPGMALSNSMHDLQAMTGLTSEKLNEIESYARKSAKTFGGSAAQGVESYKLILGQLSPEIANVPKALKSMGESVSYTSKLMGGDTTAATEVLTTAMNQYGISLEDPTKASEVMAAMMNVMAAAAGEGSAELPQIKEALEQAGMAAKGANVAFEETNAAIQVLDKAGKKGSEGGVALRNVLSTLGQGRFLPKIVQKEFQRLGININQLNNPSLSLSERLNMLKPLLKDSALMSAMFGKENANAAMALIGQTDEINRLTKAITGTNTAYEQAAIVMESPAEKNARLTAQVDDFKISLFNATGGLMGYASVLGKTAGDVANLMPVLSLMGSTISTLTNVQKMSAFWTKIVTVAQWAWNVALSANPIGIIIIAVAGLIAGIVYLASKVSGWGVAWKHTWAGAKLLFKAFIESIKLYWNTGVNGLMMGLNKIKEGWYQFKNAVGMGDEDENNAMLSQIQEDTEARKKQIVDGAKKVAEIAKNAGKEFKTGANSLKWNTDDKKESKANNSGIASPVTIPGTSTEGGEIGGAGSSGKNSKAKKINDSIATGGTKHNYITLHIKEVIGIQSYTGSKDSVTEKAGQEVLDELLRITASAITAAG